MKRCPTSILLVLSYSLVSQAALAEISVPYEQHWPTTGAFGTGRCTGKLTQLWQFKRGRIPVRYSEADGGIAYGKVAGRLFMSAAVRAKLEQQMSMRSPGILGADSVKLRITADGMVGKGAIFCGEKEGRYGAILLTKTYDALADGRAMIDLDRDHFKRTLELNTQVYGKQCAGGHAIPKLTGSIDRAEDFTCPATSPANQPVSPPATERRYVGR